MAKQIGEEMYGVVLWSDRRRHCAVIWCEDHRSLAYYKTEANAVTHDLPFGPGDLVEFEVREEEDMRLALDPSIVAERHFPGLADELIRARGMSLVGSTADLGLPGQERGMSHVLPFPDLMDRAGNTQRRPGASGRKYG